MSTAKTGARKDLLGETNRRRIGLHKALRDEPDLRHTFAELIDAIAQDQVAWGTFEKLISDGCAARVLLRLLNGCIQYDHYVALRKEALDSLKSQFDGLIGAVGTLSAKVVNLNAARIDEEPLWNSSAFDSFDERVGKKFARHYMFTELPDSLIIAKAFLKELKQNIAKEHSVRQPPPSIMLAWLYLYCCAGAGRRVSYREIADLMSACSATENGTPASSEEAIRMSLLRFKRSAASMSYEKLEVLMKDYVRSCPTGSPSLEDWTSNLDNWVASHIKPINPEKELFDKGRRRLKPAEREPPPR